MGYASEAGFTPAKRVVCQGRDDAASYWKQRTASERDSLPRSERGVWGVWRNTPQLNEGQ